MIRYFAAAGTGQYLGGWTGNYPTVNVVEVPTPPADARQPWTGTAWGPVPLTLLDYEQAVQVQLDALAQGLGYDDIRSAVTYADEPSVARFQQEGQALRRHRSLCWATCYRVLAEVQAGTRPQPSVAELLAELPPFVAGT